MKSKDALRVLADITAYQWGMVTSAQASMHGITRLDLSRLAADGQLERITHGVYRDAGAPDGPHDDLQAAWLSTDPKTMGEVRIKDRANDVVVAAESAANLHGIGDFRALRHEFVSPVRRQSQRDGIRYRQRALEPRDITLVEGLPVMTIERTIADLVEEVGDLSLVADALRDASRKLNLDLARLRELLAPLAARNGFKKSDGTALLDRLMEIAGIDPEAVARRVSADESLGSIVAANYVGNLNKAQLDRIVMTPEMQKALRSLQESISANLAATLSPAMKSLQTDIVKNAGLDDIAKKVAAQFATSDAMKEITRALSKSLSDSITIKPETLNAIREAQRVTTRA